MSTCRETFGHSCPKHQFVANIPHICELPVHDGDCVCECGEVNTVRNIAFSGAMIRDGSKIRWQVSTVQFINDSAQMDARKGEARIKSEAQSAIFEALKELIE